MRAGSNEMVSVAFGDHALIGDDEVGARCRAWQPQIVMRHEEQPDRILPEDRSLALKAA